MVVTISRAGHGVHYWSFVRDISAVLVMHIFVLALIGSHGCNSVTAITMSKAFEGNMPCPPKRSAEGYEVGGEHW